MSATANPTAEVDLTDPPKPDTKLQQALTTASIAGQVAKSAIEQGSMGLRGWLRDVGNTTAMVVLVVFAGVVYLDFRGTQKSDREYERVRSERDRDERARDRTEANAEIRALTNEIRADRESQRSVLEAQRTLTVELRGLVQAIRADRAKRE